MAFKSNSSKEVNSSVITMTIEIERIYKNKSSDEYKMLGDITKSKSYNSIENMIAHLSQLKGFPKNEIVELKNMFNALHRPIYKKMVHEYIHEPNERNIIFTALFTAGYRVLVAELSRIFASTVATDKGLVYKPDRISRNADASKFIKAFNTNLEATVDEYIRKLNSQKTDLNLKQESFVYQEAFGALGPFIGETLGRIATFITGHELIEWLHSTNEILGLAFGKFNKFNPVSLINYVLTDQYDKKVEAFYNTKKMYEETLAAYEEYKKIPESDRKKKVESKYIANINKYNIRMENLRAQIEHYDSRAKVDAKESEKKAAVAISSNNNSSSSQSSPSNDDDLDW